MALRESKRVRRYGKLAVSVAFLVVAIGYGLSVHAFDVGSVLKDLLAFSISSVVCAFALCVVQNACQATRLWSLLPGGRRLVWRDVFVAFSSGQLVNNYLPARAGDLVKIALIRDLGTRGRRRGGMDLVTDEPTHETTAANLVGSVLLADKIADVGALLGVLIITAPFELRELYSTRRVDWAALASVRWVALLAVLLVGVLLYAVPRPAMTRARALVQQVVAGTLAAARSPSSLLLALFFGMAAWVSEAGALVVLSSAMRCRVTLAQAVGALVVLNLGIAIPVSFANLGTFEAALSFGLGRAGVPTPGGIAIAVVHHAVQVLALVVIGVVSLFMRQTRAKDSDFRVQSIDKARATGYYERISEGYDDAVARGPLKWIRLRERNTVMRLAAFDDPSKRTAIDVGCGGGFYALAAKQAGLEVAVVDLSPGMLEPLEGRVDEVILGDVETFETSSKFDIVLCIGVLDFVLDPSSAFANLAALLAPGGRLVIHAPRVGIGGWLYRLEKKAIGVEVNLFALDWFEAQARKSGLHISAFTSPLPSNRVLAFEHVRSPAVHGIPFSGQAQPATGSPPRPASGFEEEPRSRQ